MNNVVDRVPTEILANGAVRWEQFDSQGNSLGYVYMKRADEPTVVGTAIDKVLFDSIQTDLTNLNNNKLNVSAKATQAQAQAGTDNTNYMTSLRTEQHFSNKKATTDEAQAGTNDTKFMTPSKVKAYIDYARGIHYTAINLSASSDNTINLANYLNDNVKKLEVVINANLTTTYRALTLNGTNIRLNEAGSSTTGGSTSINIGDASRVTEALLKFIIYKDANLFQVKGVIGSLVSSMVSNVEIDITGNYIALSSIVIGPKYDGTVSSSKNYDNQVHIYQYMK